MASTQLGLGSFGVAWAIGVPGYEPPAQPMDGLGFIRFADELGLRLVQIGDNLPLHSMSEAERSVLRDEARACGVAVEVGTRGIQTEHLREYMAIARYFGSPILRVVLDTKDHRPSPEEIVQLVRTVLPELQAANLTLAIENHDRFKVSVLADILNTLDSPNVGICLDTVNSFGSLEGSEVVVNTLGPYVVNLHAKEFVVQRARHMMGFEITGRPTGQGMMNVPWLLDKLYGFGRSFNAIIETWLPMQVTIEETLLVEARWVRASVAYLRQYIKD